MNVITFDPKLSAGAWPLAEIGICVAVFAAGVGFLARLLTRRLPKRVSVQLTNFMIGVGGIIGLYVGIKLFD